MVQLRGTATKCGNNVEGRGPKEQPNHAGISFDTTRINQIGG
jgi:hypothetical protein